MIKIESGTKSGNGNGFTISLVEPGSGLRSRKYNARNMDEVHSAIDHYFGIGRTNHHHDDVGVSNCPICRTLKTKV